MYYYFNISILYTVSNVLILYYDLTIWKWFSYYLFNYHIILIYNEYLDSSIKLFNISIFIISNILMLFLKD